MRSVQGHFLDTTTDLNNHVFRSVKFWARKIIIVFGSLKEDQELLM